MGMISEVAQEAVLQEARGLLVAKLREANREEEAARTCYVAPYSMHDAEVRFHYARGRQSGLGSAIETIDKMLGAP